MRAGARFQGRPGIFANAHMAPRDIRAHCALTASADALLRTAIARLSLSARAYHRVLKLARTVADLAGAPDRAPARERGDPVPQPGSGAALTAKYPRLTVRGGPD